MREESKQEGKAFFKRYLFLPCYLIFYLYPLPLTSLNSPVCGAVLGDLDRDGQVTLKDVAQGLRYVVGVETPYFDQRVLADVYPRWKEPPRWRGDGRIDEKDLRWILRRALGLAPPIKVAYLVATLVGNGRNRHQDGPLAQAMLSDPFDLVVASDGCVYFVDATGNRVRRLTPWGVVETIAGTGKKGDRDGPALQAEFKSPWGIDQAPSGDFYIVERFGHRVRRLSLTEGVVTTIAGNGKPGYADGVGREAQFRHPMGLRIDQEGNLYVADAYNHRIRKVTPEGVVTTIAGSGYVGLSDGPALLARFQAPAGVLKDPRDGSLYIADAENHAIRRLLPDGRVETLAGTGKAGYYDGSLSTAQFFQPWGFAWSREGDLLIVDWKNGAVRRYRDHRIETIAGTGQEGYRDGPGFQAQFFGIMNIDVDAYGNIYVADTDNERIRIIIP